MPRTHAVVGMVVDLYTGPIFRAALHLWVAAANEEQLRPRVTSLEARIGREAHRLAVEMLGADEAVAGVRETVQATLDMARGLGLANLLSDDSARRAGIVREWSAVLDGCCAAESESPCRWRVREKLTARCQWPLVTFPRTGRGGRHDAGVRRHPVVPPRLPAAPASVPGEGRGHLLGAQPYRIVDGQGAQLAHHRVEGGEFRLRDVARVPHCPCPTSGTARWIRPDSNRRDPSWQDGAPASALRPGVALIVPAPRRALRAAHRPIHGKVPGVHGRRRQTLLTSTCHDRTIGSNSCATPTPRRTSMHIPRTGRRATVTAALLACALATSLAVQADASPSTADGRPVAAAADEIVRQYEVAGAGTVAARTALAAHGVSIDAARTHSTVVTANAAQAAALRSAGYRLTALPGPPAGSDGNRGADGGASVLDFPGSDSGYHNHAEMTAEISALVAAHPAIMRQQVIGTSYGGRNIVAVKVSDNVGTDEAEPEVLFTHHQHAREHLTVEMALYLLHQFGDTYATDSRVKSIVDSREIWIIPDLNPDGGEYDIATGSYRSWRKNRQPNSGSTAVGTDLNRNWNYRWGCCGGSSGTKSSETYRGASPSPHPRSGSSRTSYAAGSSAAGSRSPRASTSTPTASSCCGPSVTPPRTPPPG